MERETNIKLKTGSVLEEFQKFLSAPEISPEYELQERVISFVRNELYPPLWRTLLKLVGAYSVSGIVVLLFCPQFGITLLAEHGILHWFSFLGEYGCMFVCGALFLGTGALVANLFLNQEEHRRIRPIRFLHFFAFALSALAIFAGLGAEIPLGMGLVWLAGSIGGEAVGFELGWLVRCSASY